MRALLAARRGALGSILAASLFPVLTVVSVASPHARSATAPRLALVSNQTASAVASGISTTCPAASSGVHRYAPGGGNTVALTFDDGPGRDTGRIIAILKQQHVTATFFNLGVHEAPNASVVKTELAAGYLFGDHTWDHQTMTLLSTSEQASEMDRERAVHRSITGDYPCLFRPPGGAYNDATLTLARDRRMTVWNWSVDPEDWKAQGSGDQYWIDRIRSRAEDGASQPHPVILLHNQVVGNPATVAALPSIIAFYKARHYRFVDLLGNTGLPKVTKLDPTQGTDAGGTRVRVYGTSLTGVRGVQFGSLVGTTLHVESSTELLITAPKHVAGPVSVIVRTNHGSSAPVTYRYVTPPPPSPPQPATPRAAIVSAIEPEALYRQPFPMP